MGKDDVKVEEEKQERNNESVIEINDKTVEINPVEEEISNEFVDKPSNKKKILFIVLGIVGVVLICVLSFILGMSFANNEDKVDDKKENVEEKEDNEKEEENQEINNIVVDFEKEFDKTYVDLKIEPGKTSLTKPQYLVDDNGEYYKNGFVGYYDDTYGDKEENFPDEEERKFISLYECKNKEFGKCGYVELAGASGDYNLEEGLKIAQDGLAYFNDRYVVIYDSEYYVEEVYGSYFSERSPAIIYDLNSKKELGKYLAVYGDSYSIDKNSIIVVGLNKKFGVIKINGSEIEEVVPMEYDYIGQIYLQDQYMLVKDGEYFYYDSYSKTKVGPFNNQISSYNDSFIVTNEGSYLEDNEKNYRLYTTSGEKVITDSGYNYITALSDDYVVVIDKDDKLNIYDKNKETLLKSSIQLNKKEGAYHIRCCGAIMKYEVYLENNTLKLSILGDSDDYEMINYLIDLETGMVSKE